MGLQRGTYRCLWRWFDDNRVPRDDCGQDRVDHGQIRVAGGRIQIISAFQDYKPRVMFTYFHGAMIKTTPRGVLRINLRKPGLSVSFSSTSSRVCAAIESMYCARSIIPRISPAVCEIGLVDASKTFEIV